MARARADFGGLPAFGFLRGFFSILAPDRLDVGRLVEELMRIFTGLVSDLVGEFLCGEGEILRFRIGFRFRFFACSPSL